MSSEARQKPVSKTGAHDLQSPLTSNGSILTKPKLHLAAYKTNTHTYVKKKKKKKKKKKERIIILNNNKIITTSLVIVN